MVLYRAANVLGSSVRPTWRSTCSEVPLTGVTHLVSRGIIDEESENMPSAPAVQISQWKYLRSLMVPSVPTSRTLPSKIPSYILSL